MDSLLSMSVLAAQLTLKPVERRDLGDDQALINEAVHSELARLVWLIAAPVSETS